MSVSVSLGSADFFFAAERAVAVEVGDVMGRCVVERTLYAVATE